MLIGLTAYARSGKDTVAQILVEQFGFVKISFADALRDMALLIDPYVDCGRDTHFSMGNTPFARYSELLQARGYDAAKACPDVRRFLQRLGSEAVRGVVGDSTWRDIVARKISESENPNIVITDVRFENEARFIEERGGVIVRLVRPGFGRETGHASETEMERWSADYTVTASTLDELTVGVQDMMTFVADIERHDAELEAILFSSPIPPLVYLAAPWEHRVEAAAAKQRMQAAGIMVVSTWTEQEVDPAEGLPFEEKARRAASDRAEVNACTAMVVLATKRSEGKATEMGMALNAGKRVIVVKGDRVGNIFYHLPEIEMVDSLESAISLLTGGFAFTIHSTSDLQPNPDGMLIAVRTDENGDKVSVETGDVVARRLGVITDIADVPNE